MASHVSLRRCNSYDRALVRQKVEELVADLGGISSFVKPGDSVLLKPNMLTSATPEQAVTTHPEVVHAVASMVKEAGGRPFIADSPAIKGFKKVAKDSGLAAVAEELNIPIHPLENSVPARAAGKDAIFKALEVSRTVLEADVIINLPKFKSHSMMLMTLAVKNMFGCIVGTRKGQWHLKAGRDRVFFARMLVELYHSLQPALNIMDGVLGMEGDGPGSSGTPIRADFLAASADGVALDRVALAIAGVKPERMFTNEVAKELHVGEADLNRIRLTGDDLNGMRLPRYKTPKIQAVFPAPGVIRRILQDQLTSHPAETRKDCTLCRQCVEICPTNVISVQGERLAFNYEDCIRCYCCVEVCPEGAMKPRRPVLSRIVEGLRG